MYEISSCSISLSTLNTVSLFNSNHSKGCVMVSHCDFNFHFPDYKICWTNFHVFTDHLYIMFYDISFQIFYPFLSYLYSYYWVIKFFILDVSLFWDICMANIFSHSLAYFFIYLCISKSKIFSFDKIQLITFFFLLFVFFLPLPTPRSWRFFFSSRRLVISAFTFILWHGLC